MLHNDIMHPINIAWLICDVVTVVLRSFSPETLVRKRARRTASRSSDVSRHRSRSRSRYLRGSSSRAPSANVSLNISAAATGELPPLVPLRQNPNSSRTHRHHRSRSAEDSDRDPNRTHRNHRSRSAEDSDRESNRTHRHHRSRSAEDSDRESNRTHRNHRSRSAEDSDRESNRTHRNHRSRSAEDSDRESNRTHRNHRSRSAEDSDRESNRTHRHHRSRSAEDSDRESNRTHRNHRSRSAEDSDRDPNRTHRNHRSRSAEDSDRESNRTHRHHRSRSAEDSDRESNRTHRNHRSRSAEDSDRDPNRTHRNHRSRSAEDSDRESNRTHRNHRSRSAEDSDRESNRTHRNHRSRSAEDSDRESNRTHRNHRSRSAEDSDRERRRGKEAERKDREGGVDEQTNRSRQWWSWISDWRSLNVTRPMNLLAHVLRAAPVSLLHFLCQVKTDAAALPLLRFADLSDTARRLIPRDEQEVFAPGFVAGFLVTRVLLAVAQQYWIERVMLENTLVVRYLRSHHVWRHAIGWALSLSSRIPVDPITNSILTPILLLRVRDLSPVTGSLRYTPIGIVAGAALGCAGVALEMLVVPVASQLCQRAVVRIADGAEYVLFRRYSRGPRGRDLEANRNKDRGSGGSEAGGKDSENESVERAGEDNEMAQRRQRLAEKRIEAEVSAHHRFIMRAIVYRVIAALVAQCLVQHPLTVVAHMLYSRAVLHATGLLTVYDHSPLEYPTWRGFLALLRIGETATTGGVPAAIQFLRRIGQFAGNEVATIRQSVREQSERDVAIRELVERLGRRGGGGGEGEREEMGMRGNVASAMESAEFMMLSLASLAPLFTAVPFTAVDKLLSFYVAVWTRVSRE